ncbi:MAG: FadR/GntR family transcriptional regulator [Armatimonadota bacterium]|nr:FadR family transcriptional regulator [bacterium]
MSVTDLSNLNVAERITLTDDIVEKLIQHIADNNLRVGDMLPSESQLTEALGVSRLPLREALSRLKALGVITVRQGKGAIIQSVNVSNLFRQLSPIMRSQGNLNVQHMVEVRQSIEPSVARLAAVRRNDASLAPMRECIACMEANLTDIVEFIRCDMEFHNAIALATGNPALDILMSTIHDIMSATQWSYPDDIRSREVSLEHHKKIYAAILRHDADGAASAIEAHISDIEQGISKEQR